MQRRSFLTGLGAAAWPLAGRAQSAMPVVGYLTVGRLNGSPQFLAAFRKGLSETGFDEGRNVVIEFREANNDTSRLPELAAELVRHRPSVIAALVHSAAVFAVKAATSTTPIVFTTGEDPIKAGLVASFNRPGGNITGIVSMAVELAPKRLGLLHELVAGAKRFAVLINPNGPIADPVVIELKTAAAAVGGQIDMFEAATLDEIEATFVRLAQNRTDALVISPDTLFGGGGSGASQLAVLAARHAMPAIHWQREFPTVGGLISYGMSVPEQYRLAGTYVGRVLKGEKPADLPVQQPTLFELVINMKTANALGLTVPLTLQVAATEVIE